MSLSICRYLSQRKTNCPKIAHWFCLVDIKSNQLNASVVFISLTIPFITDPLPKETESRVPASTVTCAIKCIDLTREMAFPLKVFMALGYCNGS